MKKLIASAILAVAPVLSWADNVLVIDPVYSNLAQNVESRLVAAGHTVTITTDTTQIPSSTGSYQQVWDLRPQTALSSTEQTALSSFVTGGGFAYFVTENPGCCMVRNNSVAALITSLGGGTTNIGPGWANNVESNVNTTYMTSGITVNYAAVAAIVNSQGIPLISDANGNVSGMSWIGRAGALGSGVTGTIVTVADVNWLDATRFNATGTTAQQQNVQALDDIIRGIVAGTVSGTISASGNGAGATNGNSGGTPPAPTTFDHTNTTENVAANTMASGTFTGNGGTLTANSATPDVSNGILLSSGGLTYDANGLNTTLSGVISGSGDITFTGSGVTTISGTNTYTGLTNIQSGASLTNTGNIASSSGVMNYGTFTNSGVTGDWYNGSTGTINNSGTMNNGVNVGLFTNTGSVGTVVNTGTFTNTGTLASINNGGIFVTTPTTLATYSQSSTGSTVLDYGSQLTVTGAATLDGNLTLLGTAPSSVGRYTVLTGNGVTGTYSSYTGVGVLRYTPTEVQYWVFPSQQTLQSQVDTQATALSRLTGLSGASTLGSLGNDCGSFGDKGGCIAVNVGSSKTGTGDLNTAGITVSKSIDANWRAGVFTSSNLNNPSSGDVSYTAKNPALGVMVGWNEGADGIGYGVGASAVVNSGDYSLGGYRAGAKTQAYQVKATFTKPLDATTFVTPYAGVRYSRTSVDGYTEVGPVFPLTFGGVTQTSTDLLAGVSASTKVADGLTASVNAGVVHNLDYNAGTVTATGEPGAYQSNLAGTRKTSAALGAGLSYAIDKETKIGASIGWQQKGTTSDISSVGVNLTKSF
jgi:hypothetical protein